MSALAGTGRLLRLAARRDRVVAPACALAVVVLVLATATGLQGLYPTAADRAAFAATVEGSAAFAALYGPPRALSSLGGLVAWRILASGTTIVGLISLMLVVRHTRAEEERGQTEMLLATATGRRAPLAAALALVGILNVAIAAGTALALLAVGLPVPGCVAFGAALAGAGLVFASVGAVTAQVADTARAARGIAAAVLGVGYVLRAAGDSGFPVLGWLSPLGWSSQLRPFADERWAPLGISVVAVAVLLGVAAGLLDRRDLGSGLRTAPPGPPRGSRLLSTPEGLALRLHRASLLGWSAAALCAGAAIGAAGANAADLMETSQAIKDILTQRGGGAVTDQFSASMAAILAIIATAATISAVLRARSEESAGRAEPVLATAGSRSRWLGSHLLVAGGVTVLTLLSAGVGMGLAAAVTSRDLDQLWRLIGATLVQTPAAWLLGAAAAALVGLAPRAAAGAWLALSGCLALLLLGPLLDLPGWVLGLSPYQHVPAVPAVPVTAGPLLALTAVAAALIGAGVAGIRRRDIG